MTGIGFLSSPRIRIRSPRWQVLDTLVFVMIGFLVVLAVLGPYITPHDPYRSEPSLRLLAPQPGYWLGTDDAGRDILSRLLVGARETMFSSLIVVLCSTAIGIAVASLAVLGPRWLDGLLLRLCDIVLALPGLLLALAIAMALGSGIQSAVIALVVASWPAVTRLAHGVLRKQLASPFVEAARVMGISKWKLLIWHLLPNSLDEVVVNATAMIGGVTLWMAGLSYIGVGAQAPSAEWGAMATQAAPYLLTNWTAAFIPGVLIAMSAFSFSLLGDIIHARIDPALRKDR